MVYYDTDSIRCNVEQFKLYPDTLKVVAPTAKERLAMKLYLNSVYGKMVSSMKWTNGKENKDMNKNYIVVHDTVNGIGIVFKDKIGGVFKENEDGTARLLIVDGYTLPTVDKYEDIIKQII